jgi:phosphoglycolate phosphatase-like HAD superfamily hydrolase
MIGDGTVDVQAGRAAGCRTILVTDLKISQIEQFHNMAGAMPDLVVKNLDAAWEAIQRGGDGKAG